MTLYEIIVAVVAVTNLVMNLVLFAATRHKAASAKVDELRTLVERHSLDLAALTASAERAPSHDDLASVYTAVNATRHIVERLAGEMEQMNSTIRLLLQQLVQGKGK